MTDNFVQLPDDSPNTGKKVRTHSETIGGNVVHTHVFVPAVDSGSGDEAVSASNPLPVTGVVTTTGLTDTELRATPVPVSGTVSVTEPVSVDDNGGSLTVDGPLTDTELRATPVPISGTVATGGLTDTELRATPVPVSGTVSVNEPVSIDDNGGSITVDGPLTDTQLRATPVPVSGTVSVTEPVSVDDNGGSLTVDDGGGSITIDGAVTVSGTVDTELTTADLDTGAGTDTRAVVGMVLAASGGGLLVGTANPMPVSDNGGSLTVDNTDLTAAAADINSIEKAITADSAPDPSSSMSVAGSDGATQYFIPLSSGGTSVVVAGPGGTLTVDDGSLSLTVDGAVSVDDGGGSVTVDGAVTANAGTNLNTSALALETGGNLAAAAVSLSIVDDWDESDRAKINPIVGQAGVQGNTGTVSATTQRVVLATDVALPTGTNSIGKISDVTTSVTPGTAAANLGKAEDAAHTTGDTGVMALAVRNDALASRSDADGDYTPVAVHESGAVALAAWDPNDTGLLLPLGGSNQGDGTANLNVAVMGNVNAVVLQLPANTYNPSFTGSGTSAMSSSAPYLKYVSLQVKGTGAGATSWTVAVEASNNNANWTPILTHATADLDGTTKMLTTPFVANYTRINCSVVVLGGASNIQVYATISA